MDKYQTYEIKASGLWVEPGDLQDALSFLWALMWACGSLPSKFITMLKTYHKLLTLVIFS